MTIYTYEHKCNILGIKVIQRFGVAQSKVYDVLRPILRILETFVLGILFYLNYTYVHSRLFALFIFIIGFYLVFCTTITKKISSKEEFLSKVNEILGDD